MEKINTEAKENLGLFGLLQNIKFFQENKAWIMPLAAEIMEAINARQESTQKKFNAVGTKLDEVVDEFNKLESKLLSLEQKIQALESVKKS